MIFLATLKIFAQPSALAQASTALWATGISLLKEGLGGASVFLAAVRGAGLAVVPALVADVLAAEVDYLLVEGFQEAALVVEVEEACSSFF